MSDDDIFDVCDDNETQIRNKGYEAGELEAQKLSYKSGHLKGWKQSFHLFQELGSLRGIISVLLNNFSVETSGEIGKEVDIRLKSKDCLVLKKILTDINNTSLWLERGKQSEEELAQHINKLHTKTRYILKKYNIPNSLDGKEVDAEF